MSFGVGESGKAPRESTKRYGVSLCELSEGTFRKRGKCSLPVLQDAAADGWEQSEEKTGCLRSACVWGEVQ